jgi:MPBQ/MSBQ methyltransferase
VAACDRMVDEVTAAVRPDAAVIVDVGCGLGAGTRRVCDRFPRALVIGANLSLWQLTQARRRGVGATLGLDAAQLPLGSGTADAVLAIESPQHFDTRAAFVAEAYRVLKPGGVLVMADMLFADGEAIGAWMLPRGNQVDTLEDYAAIFREAGFAEVDVRDITAISWRPFCAAMRAVFEGEESALRAIEESLSYYVLAVARRVRGA